MNATVQTPNDPLVQRLVAENLDRIREVYGPCSLYLFGSRARGDARSYSDIDLILVSERCGDVKFVNRAAQFYGKVKPDLPVEIICYTPEEFERMSDGVGFIPDALKESVRLL